MCRLDEIEEKCRYTQYFIHNYIVLLIKRYIIYDVVLAKIHDRKSYPGKVCDKFHLCAERLLLP